MDEQTASGPPALRREVAETARLAGPAIVARAGMLVMSIADTVMVGRYAVADLAYLGMAWSLSTTLLVACIGLLMGTLVKTGHAYGRGDFVRMRPCLAPGAARSRRSQAASPSRSASRRRRCCACSARATIWSSRGAVVTIAYGAGLPGVAIAVASQFFLEGVQRPLPAMFAMMAANVVNIALNAMLIYGEAGAPAMGAEGAAWATTAARWLLAALAVGYILCMRGPAQVRGRPAAAARLAGASRAAEDRASRPAWP